MNYYWILIVVTEFFFTASYIKHYDVQHLTYVEVYSHFWKLGFKPCSIKLCEFWSNVMFSLHIKTQ